MADVIILFAGLVIVLAGAIVSAALVRKGVRDRKTLPGKITRRRERELNRLDAYIRKLDQAASEEDIQRLEQDKKEGR